MNRNCALLLTISIFAAMMLEEVDGLCPRVAKWKRQKFCETDIQIANEAHDWFSQKFSNTPYEYEPKELNVRTSDTRVTRREYRTLRTAERQKLHRCLLAMTATLSPDEGSYYGQSQLSSFVTQHRFQYSPQAHGSAAFTPYHKVFLFFFESILQTHEGCEEVGLPYWDSTLDSFLPNPADSAIFEDNYLGNSRGNVKADYVNDTHHITTVYCKGYGDSLKRAVCKDGAQLMTDAYIEEYLSCGPDYTNCAMPKNGRFEEVHGIVHGCLGGHMADLSCAPYDLLFYLHHSFVDLLFEQYLDKAYPDVDPINAYILDSDIYYLRGDEPMRPFDKSGYRVRDGMSRNFTRDFYRYAPRPFACRQDSHCRSSLLWCDEEAERCKAKVRLGGDCTGLHPQKSCFANGKCGGKKAICSPNTKTCECAI